MTNGRARYLPALTTMRGLAALWVMLFHIDVSLFYRNLGPLVPHDLTGLITSGYLWVDFFFILSGFVIAHVYGGRFASGLTIASVRDYLRHRFLRIYPLHLFTLLLLILFAWRVAALAPHLVDDSVASYFAPEALPSNILLMNAMNQHVYLSWNIVSWSIGAEWWTYFAALVLLVALRLRRAGETMLVIGFCCLTSLVLLHVGGNLDITFDYGFFRCLFEFTMGLGVYRLFNRGIGKGALASDRLMLMLLGLLCATFHWRWPDLLAPPLFAVLVLAAAYNEGAFSRVMQARLLQYLGRISYSIYLMHGVWFMVFWTFLPMVKAATHWQAMPSVYALLYTFVFMGLSLASAHLTYRFIEVPGRTLFGKLAARRSASFQQGGLS